MDEEKKNNQGKKVKKKVTKQEKKVERQLIRILIFFGFLVVLFFVASLIFQKFSKIEYEGLTFTKEKFGQLTFYHYYYYFPSESGAINRYNLYLRNDPRYNDVRLVQNAPIEFESSGRNKSSVMMTINVPSDLGQCSESFAAIGTLAGFLSDNEIKVKSGVMNPVEAILQNRTYATCENQDTSVIQITSGEETWIEINKSCHTITIGPDCNVMKAIEKYEVHTILDSKVGTISP